MRGKRLGLGYPAVKCRHKVEGKMPRIQWIVREKGVSVIRLGLLPRLVHCYLYP